MAADPSNVLASSGDYHLNLTSEAAAHFRRVMREFLEESECCLGAVIERSGAVIVSEQSNPVRGAKLPRPDSLGVLAAGLFASTQMMAEQMGEEESPEVLCHGKELHVFVAPLSEEFAILAVFPDRVAVGLVRLHAKRAAHQMLEELKQIIRNPTTMAPATGAISSGATAGPGAPGPEEIESPFMRYN